MRSDARIGCGERANNGSCAIRTAIVDNQHFGVHAPRAERVQDSRDGAGDDLLFVIGGQDDREDVLLARAFSFAPDCLVSCVAMHSLLVVTGDMAASSDDFWRGNDAVSQICFSDLLTKTHRRIHGRR